MSSGLYVKRIETINNIREYEYINYENIKLNDLIQTNIMPNSQKHIINRPEDYEPIYGKVINIGTSQENIQITNSNNNIINTWKLEPNISNHMYFISKLTTDIPSWYIPSEFYTF